MKHLIIPAGLIIVIWVASCKPTDPMHTQIGDQNKALLEKFTQAIINDDSTQLMNLIADDYMRYGPAISDSVNKDQFIAMVKSWQEWGMTITPNRVARLTFSSSETIPTELVEGDWVFWWGQITATFKDGSPSATVNYHEAVKVVNNQISRDHIFWDYADYAIQRGYKLVAPGDSSSSN